MKNQVLYLLADDFSDNSKEAFFERELPFLCKAFKQVYVISLYPEENRILNFTADNLEVLQFNYFAALNRISVFSRYFFLIAKIFLHEMLNTHNRWFYLRNFREMLNYLVLTTGAAKNLEKLIAKDIGSGTVFYSYWFKQWPAALSILKLSHKDLKLVSRVHGGDYDEEQVGSVLQFRHYQLSKINKVFPVSEFAAGYLKQKFKLSEKKISVSRLGLPYQHELSPTSPNHLVLVSCSAVIELKRVHLIIEILRLIKMPVSWIHFGDGPLLAEVKAKAATLERNVAVQFKGYVPNHEFISYLKENPVSYFVNVSSSEGIPVSMMEAISFGIPLIGTAICGVPEIVTERTGMLIPAGFNPGSVAEQIENNHRSAGIYSIPFRKGIQEFYQSFFYAPANFSKLAAELSYI